MMRVESTVPGTLLAEQFLRFPYTIYAPAFHKALNNELVQEHLSACYLVMEGETILARASLYENPHLRYNGERAVCLGHYEAIDDKDVAAMLIGHISLEASELKAMYLLGPMNGSTWEHYRFSTHHEHPHFMLEPYHHLYYIKHFTDNGFLPMAGYTSRLDQEVCFDRKEVLALDESLRLQGVRIRKISLENYEEELERLYCLSINVFNSNFLFTPISWQRFREKYLKALPLIDPELVLLAEDDRQQLIGFIFSYQDHKDTPVLIVKTVARDPAPRWNGLGKVLGNRVVRLARSRGISRVVHAFMIENATSSSLSDTFMGKIYKNYCLYGKSL